MRSLGGSATGIGSTLAKTTVVLALNTGSSSLKFALYRMRAAQPDCILAGETERLGEAEAHTRVTEPNNRIVLDEASAARDHRQALARIWQILDEGRYPTPSAIGHRIVHGGPDVREHCVITPPVLEALRSASVFAPLHTPAAISVIEACTDHFPEIAQAACLDTSFHTTLPTVASTLPLPHGLRAAGLRRYGFHGLSCKSIVQQLSGRLPERLVIAHLGNGASITAVRAGRSIDTSMGLTPAGGVIMGTRSGDLDPGVLTYLMRELELDAEGLDRLVNHGSGLLALSGCSGDMRSLHEAAGANADARLAINMFCYAVAKQMGAMVTVLGGLDMIVFTGGIGEHDAAVRTGICTHLACHGVMLDEPRNRLGHDHISRDASPCQVLVLPSQEDLQVARHTWVLCAPGPVAASSPQPASRQD